ncbi:MAG TPA: Trm112 family protein [Verrucomicrobiae bacterium]|nr:Trm112 family protein [Verrucomicrobiae bacterium]
MIRPELLEILCCPETRQPLRLADSALVETLNQQIADGTLRNFQGKPVAEKLDAALIRADGICIYPVRQNIPLLLAAEAISLKPNNSPIPQTTLSME